MNLNLDLDLKDKLCYAAEIEEPKRFKVIVDEIYDEYVAGGFEKKDCLDEFEKAYKVIEEKKKDCQDWLDHLLKEDDDEGKNKFSLELMYWNEKSNALKRSKFVKGLVKEIIEAESLEPFSEILEYKFLVAGAMMVAVDETKKYNYRLVCYDLEPEEEEKLAKDIVDLTVLNLLYKRMKAYFEILEHFEKISAFLEMKEEFKEIKEKAKAEILSSKLGSIERMKEFAKVDTELMVYSKDDANRVFTLVEKIIDEEFGQ